MAPIWQSHPFVSAAGILGIGDFDQGSSQKRFVAPGLHLIGRLFIGKSLIVHCMLNIVHFFLSFLIYM